MCMLYCWSCLEVFLLKVFNSLKNVCYKEVTDGPQTSDEPCFLNKWGLVLKKTVFSRNTPSHWNSRSVNINDLLSLWSGSAGDICLSLFRSAVCSGQEPSTFYVTFRNWWMWNRTWISWLLNLLIWDLRLRRLFCVCVSPTDIPEEEARYWAKKLEQLNAMRDQDVSLVSSLCAVVSACTSKKIWHQLTYKIHCGFSLSKQ